MNQLPKVNTFKLKTLLDDREYYFASRILKTDGRIKVAKPNDNGFIQYIWRMVVFQVSPLPQHQCMPIMASFYIPADYGTDKYKELMTLGNKIADAIVDCVPMNLWHGIKRWAEVL